MTLVRITKEFQLYGDDNETKITLGRKEIIVKHSIRKLIESWKDWGNGNLIQNSFPYLTADEREFILTGITKEEWEELFGE